MQTAPGPTVDFDHLESFVGGDLAVADEVLGLFQQQAELWTAMLDPEVEGWRDAVHAMKGAAGGIGARPLAAACDTAERGDPGLAGPAILRVRDELGQALVEISGRRRRYALAALKT